MTVPTSSQTVAHATYSNITLTVAGSPDGALPRPGSRSIRVLSAEPLIAIALPRNPRGTRRGGSYVPGSSPIAMPNHTPSTRSLLSRVARVRSIGTPCVQSPVPPVSTRDVWIIVDWENHGHARRELSGQGRQKRTGPRASTGAY